MIRVPAKVIIAGEHAVVHGIPALAMSIPVFMTLKNCHKSETGYELHVTQNTMGSISVYTEDGDALINKVLRALHELFPEYSQGLTFTIENDIPVGAGLGSSAALAVLLVKSIDAFYKLQLQSNAIREKAHMLENIFHGKSSGLDDTVISNPGICLFQKPHISDELYSVLNSIEHKVLHEQAVALQLDVSGFIVVDSGIPRQTKAMVSRVQEYLKVKPQETKQLFYGIQACVTGLMKAFRNHDQETIAKLINTNHDYLQQLGLSHPSLEDIKQECFKEGALGAKVTGAGGGGCMLVYAPKQERHIYKYFQSLGKRVWIC